MKLDQALVAGFMMTIAKPGFRVQVRSFYGILNSRFNILSGVSMLTIDIKLN